MRQPDPCAIHFSAPHADRHLQTRTNDLERTAHHPVADAGMPRVFPQILFGRRPRTAPVPRNHDRSQLVSLLLMGLLARVHGAQGASSATQDSGSDPFQGAPRRRYGVSAPVRPQPRKFLSNTTVCPDALPNRLQTAPLSYRGGSFRYALSKLHLRLNILPSSRLTAAQVLAAPPAAQGNLA